MRNHEKAFADIKNYYNDITLNNLALINSLKEQVEEMKRKEERSEKLMVEITNENKRLLEPLNKALSEVEDLRKQLASHDKDKSSLQASKARIRVMEDEKKALDWEHEVLRQRFAQVEKERDELYERFLASVHEVQQKSGLRNLLLERKLETLSEALEKKEAQLNEVLAASNLDPTALAAVTQKLEDVLEAKNNMIKDLQYDLARVSKAHNDLIRTYESRLREMGVPAEDLGFRPLATRPGQVLGMGPAGLVSAPPM
jgi:growth arrest-specific protein 8